MRNHRTYVRLRQPIIFSIALFTDIVASNVSAQWLQFGGPRRDFTCDPIELKTDWPPDGPRRIWTRPFGDGYSGILLNEGSVYSTYRDGDSEVVDSLDAETGNRRWQYVFADPVDKSRFASRYGYGPRSTPLIVGHRLFVVSFNGRLICLNHRTGRHEWSIDLVDRFGARLPRWGYANSPIAFGDRVILPVGGPGSAFAALDQATGNTVWRQHDFENSYGSPILIDLEGQTQLVCLMAREIVGLDPRQGNLLWSHGHEGQWLNNIPNPIWRSDHSLLVTSEGDAGTRLLHLTRADGTTRVRQAWATQGFRVVHRNLICMGNTAYGSSGDFGPSVFSALDMQSGAIVWKDRQISRAGILLVGTKLLLLEESGNLVLASPRDNGVTIHARAALLEESAWTIPTLVNKRLYLRDRKSIMAVELP